VKVDLVLTLVVNDPYVRCPGRDGLDLAAGTLFIETTAW
jgi:hypothetical protein